jgi:predicted enzyme related to lactoylglutathione lyase
VLGADHHAGEGRLGNLDRKSGLLAQPLVQADQERALGRPLDASRPRISACASSRTGAAEPMVSLNLPAGPAASARASCPSRSTAPADPSHLAFRIDSLPAVSSSSSRPDPVLALVEFPADEAARARRFWEGLLDCRSSRAGRRSEGWQTREGGVGIGLHVRGPGDRVSSPYFAVPDLAAALHRVRALGGEVIHPGERLAICRDSEGSPFRAPAGGRRRLTSANRPDRRPIRRWPYGSQSCWR